MLPVRGGAGVNVKVDHIIILLEKKEKIHPLFPLLPPLSRKRVCRNLCLSLRATEGGVAILFSMDYEIASVVSFPRNDLIRNFSDTPKKYS
jgi:hypothetical protein